MSENNTQYYLIHVFGCVEPEIVAGPFDNYDILTDEARKLFLSSDDFSEEQDMLFSLMVDGKNMPSVSSFSSSDFENDED